MEYDTEHVDGHTLYRIKSLKDFNGIRAGELGGYIEKEYNLSHEGNCWVHKHAMVYDGAMVREDAQIGGAAIVAGNAFIYEKAKITGNAGVCGRAHVKGTATIKEHARVFDDAVIGGDTIVGGHAYIGRDSVLIDNSGFNRTSNPNVVMTDNTPPDGYYPFIWSTLTGVVCGVFMGSILAMLLI